MKRVVSASLWASAASLIALSATNWSGAMAQQQTQPKARYNMDVGTVTGIGAMGGGMGGAMSMMFGGGGSKTAYELQLRLGSSLTPTKGAPKADHFPLPALKAGKSLPLISPQAEPGEKITDFQRPKGRLLIYWGCGAKAPKGQPVIIDFAKVAQGQFPPGLFSTRVPADRSVRFSNSKTYGDWPNSKSGKPPGNGASLLGEHRVVSNYAPEIKFSLTQDFMGALNVNAAPAPGGATNLSWNRLDAATGFYAWMMGMRMDRSSGEPTGDMVWWSSSAAREFGGGLWDWLAPATVQRLVGEKVVMPPTQTTCLVPAEVKAAAPDMQFGTLYAYGPEANFAYPPKPATGPWNLDWTSRVRYRSTTTWMGGGAMGGMMSGQNEQEPAKPKCKPSVLGAVLGKGC